MEYFMFAVTCNWDFSDGCFGSGFFLADPYLCNPKLLLDCS